MMIEKVNRMARNDLLPEIWVLAEQVGARWETVTLELLQDAQAFGKKIGWKVVCIVFSKPNSVDDTACQLLAAHGAEQVVILENETFCEAGEVLRYGPVLSNYVEGQRPRLLLCPSTPSWIETASWLTVEWDGSIVQDVISFRQLPDKTLEVTRSAWGNKVHVKLCLPEGRSWTVCLRPGVAGVGQSNSRVKAQITREQVEPFLSKNIKLKSLLPPHPSQLDLTEAERVIAGGRGVNGLNGFKLLEELATILESAVGATRVAVDLGWASYSRQIGQTGKTIKPRLYIAVGISGASQHVDGIRDSEVIIAINKDKNAKIFKLAHLGIVGDATTIVQGLIETLKEHSDNGKLPIAIKA